MSRQTLLLLLLVVALVSLCHARYTIYTSFLLPQSNAIDAEIIRVGRSSGLSSMASTLRKVDFSVTPLGQAIGWSRVLKPAGGRKNAPAQPPGPNRDFNIVQNVNFSFIGNFYDFTGNFSTARLVLRSSGTNSTAGDVALAPTFPVYQDAHLRGSVILNTTSSPYLAFRGLVLQILDNSGTVQLEGYFTSQYGDFVSYMDGSQEVPPTASLGEGFAIVSARFTSNGQDLSSIGDLAAQDAYLAAQEHLYAVLWSNFDPNLVNITAAHIHAPAGPNATAPVYVPFTLIPNYPDLGYILNYNQKTGANNISFLVNYLFSYEAYTNVHTNFYPAGGAIRGQLLSLVKPSNILAPLNVNVSRGSLGGNRNLRALRTMSNTNRTGSNQGALSLQPPFTGDFYFPLFNGINNVETLRGYVIELNLRAPVGSSYTLQRMEVDGSFQTLGSFTSKNSARFAEVYVLEFPTDVGAIVDAGNPYKPEFEVLRFTSAAGAGALELDVFSVTKLVPDDTASQMLYRPLKAWYNRIGTRAIPKAVAK